MSWDAISKSQHGFEPLRTCERFVDYSPKQALDNAHDNTQDRGKLRRGRGKVQSQKARAFGDANATTALPRPICKRPASAEQAATKQQNAKEVAVPAGVVQSAATKQKRLKRSGTVPAVAVQASVCPLDFFSICSLDIIAAIMKNCFVRPQMQFNQIAVTNRRNNVGWRAMINPIQVGMVEGFLLDIVPWVNNQLAEIDVPVMPLYDLIDTMWSSSQYVSSRHTMTPSSSMIQIEDHVC
jgi:hypothetical protein